MGMYSGLFETNSPWVFKTKDRLSATEFKYLNSADSTTIVEVEGSCMKNFSGFYNEISNAFSFPEYSGHNLNALFDSLTDLVWMTNSGVLFVIRNAGFVLEEESENSLSGFLDVLARAGQDWASCSADGNEWDRPAIPFNTLMEINADNSRYQFVGIDMI